MNPGKQVIVGVGISRTSYAEVTEICREWLERRDNPALGPARYICVTSAHGIVSSVFDAHFRAILNRADIATPDGMPIVWALRSFGFRSASRVYGPTLMLKLCAMASKSSYEIFLYGGKPEVLDKLRGNLISQFPALKIVGAYSPPFRPLTPAEHASVADMIRRSGAKFVFVGLSTPKQEYWMATQRRALPGRIIVGVGAAFDFHAKTLPQAPEWMQNAGLEWLFRLMTEPKRLWKRYLLVTPLFLPLWALQKARFLTYRQRNV